MTKILSALKRIFTAIAIVMFVLVTPLIGHRAHKHYIYDYKGSSVVRLTQSGSGGTGFRVIAPSGKRYILTNYHVCMLGYTKGWLAAEDYRGYRYRLEIIEKYKKHDLCLVQDVPGIPALKLANNVLSHEQVYLVGHPRLANLTMESGSIVSRLTIQLVMPTPWFDKCVNGRAYKTPFDKELFMTLGIKLCLRDFRAIHANLISYGGNSGSPVLDDFGNVIGVLFAGSPRAVTATFLVPLEHIKMFLHNK